MSLFQGQVQIDRSRILNPTLKKGCFGSNKNQLWIQIPPVKKKHIFFCYCLNFLSKCQQKIFIINLYLFLAGIDCLIWKFFLGMQKKIRTGASCARCFMQLVVRLEFLHKKNVSFTLYSCPKCIAFVVIVCVNVKRVNATSSWMQKINLIIYFERARIR